MANVNHAKGGEFATARKGGMDACEVAFVRQKHGEGFSDFAIARMIGRALVSVQSVTKPIQIAAALNEPTPEPLNVLGPKSVAPRPRVTRERESRPMPFRAREAIEALAKWHGVYFAALIGDETTKAISCARQEAFWVLRYKFRKPNDEPMYSLPQIGGWLGGRDHCTVHKGIKAHERRKAAYGEGWRPSISARAERRAKARANALQVAA